jgi:transketolase
MEISTVKPIDEPALLESVRKTRKILTVEERSVLGGLGGAVAEILRRFAPARWISSECATVSRSPASTWN